MNELYTIQPCPKCGTDCWQRRGGYGQIREYYVCMTCGMDTNRIREALARQEAVAR